MSYHDLTTVTAAPYRPSYLSNGRCPDQATRRYSLVVSYAGSKYFGNYFESLSQATGKSSATTAGPGLRKKTSCM